MTRLFASPTFARWLQSESASISRLPASRPPWRSKEKIEPAPREREHRHQHVLADRRLVLVDVADRATGRERVYVDGVEPGDHCLDELQPPGPLDVPGSEAHAEHGVRLRERLTPLLRRPQGDELDPVQARREVGPGPDPQLLRDDDLHERVEARRDVTRPVLKPSQCIRPR